METYRTLTINQRINLANYCGGEKILSPPQIQHCGGERPHCPRGSDVYTSERSNHAYCLRSVVVAKLLYDCSAWSGFITAITASTRSSAAANAVAVASVNQAFRPSTNLWRNPTIGCSTNFAVALCYLCT